MKNKEKYAKEIIEVACSGDSIAVTKVGERVVRCGNIACSECLFTPLNCVEKIREWAEQENIKKPVISKRDKAFLEYIKEKYKYMAIDDDGCLFAYITKPYKNYIFDRWSSDTNCVGVSRYFDVDFPMVKWEDEEPWLVEDLKKLEVVEEYEK